MIRGLGLRFVAGLMLAASAVLMNGAAAEIGDVQMCVSLRQIDDSRVIDDETILLRLTSGTPYRRIDLDPGCPGLRMADSFSSATSIGQLCRSDVIRVHEDPVGSQCVIDQIVIIDEAEAKTLLASRKR